MKTLLVIVAILILAMDGIVGVACSGMLDVYATAKEPGVIRWLLQTSRCSSVSVIADALRLRWAQL